MFYTRNPLHDVVMSEILTIVIFYIQTIYCGSKPVHMYLSYSKAAKKTFYLSNNSNSLNLSSTSLEF